MTLRRPKAEGEAAAGKPFMRFTSGTGQVLLNSGLPPQAREIKVCQFNYEARVSCVLLGVADHGWIDGAHDGFLQDLYGVTQNTLNTWLQVTPKQPLRRMVPYIKSGKLDTALFSFKTAGEADKFTERIGQYSPGTA